MTGRWEATVVIDRPIEAVLAAFADVAGIIGQMTEERRLRGLVDSRAGARS